jgi:hypothetical protein
MTSVAKFSTLNPTFQFDVVHGSLPNELLHERTLRFMLEDNDRAYDQIEWTLDNTDGVFTRVENLALGLIIRVRLGYPDRSTGWRAFVITRLRGGVGVYGAGNAPVSDNDREITLSGRNRNAPDIKGRHKRGNRSPRSTGKGYGSRRVKRRGPPSPSITRLEDLRKDGLSDETEKDRVFQVQRVSDAARELARRFGYGDNSILIQDTQDVSESIVVPAGWTYAHFFHEMAERVGYIFKMGRIFEFHEPRWQQAKGKIDHTFLYGDGRDILDLSVDGDFRLPVPRNVKMRAYNPVSRSITVANASPEDSPVVDAITQVTLGGTRSRTRNSEEIDSNLRQSEVYHFSGASQNLKDHKAQKLFFNRNIRALHLTVTVVGNPTVIARDLVSIKGTGAQFVDSKPWYVGKARHIYNGTTYVTTMSLQQPPRRRKPRGGPAVDTDVLNDKGAASARNARTKVKLGLTAKEAAARRVGLKK